MTSIASYESAPRIGYKFWTTRELTLPEVAKLIREDIKELRRESHHFAPYKYSVRCERGGGAIRVTISGDHQGNMPKNEVRRQIEGILDAYNYDASDSMYDYSCNRFFAFVDWEEA